jgi:hypothetical protein
MRIGGVKSPFLGPSMSRTSGVLNWSFPKYGVIFNLVNPEEFKISFI